MGTKKNSLIFGTRIGLLGGGQLARMLALKGHELGLEIHVLSEKPSDPAAQVTRHWHQGSPSNLNDLISFFKNVDVVTVESEFHEATLLAQAEKSSGTALYPSAKNLSTLQDRLPQKQQILASGLRTAAFLTVDSHADLDRAMEQFKGEFVLKKRRGGYDGYGTFIVRTLKDLAKTKIAIDPSKTPCIAEAFVPFRRELAIVVSRNTQGEMGILPLVETHQVQSRLDWLKGPIRHPEIKSLLKGISKLLQQMNYVGTIAFELFETKDRRLWINEIAPRVHNSGHYSLEAMESDQFRLHLLAILGKSLPTHPVATAFAMTNLIGQGSDSPQTPTDLTGHLHWYGKTESRKGRKMGHVTYLGNNSTLLLKKALKERKGFKL